MTTDISRSQGAGPCWYCQANGVRVTWPTGAPEDVNFSGEIEAIEWIRDKSSAWLAKRSA